MAQGPSMRLCEYINVKTYKILAEENDAQASTEKGAVNGRIFRHWTYLWVVLSTEISPSFCFIGHCKKEGDWLVNNKIEKVYLGETFTIERLPSGYSKKFEHVLQLSFKSYRMDLGFDSMTKMEQWYLALRHVCDCHHVDLVRCPERPELEGEYVVQVCSTSFIVWTVDSNSESKVRWEWFLKHVRRVHWHKNLHKLEVEPGRSSQTGEGHFYFTGQHASRLFSVMRHMMTAHSQILSPSASNTASPITSPTPSTRRRDGSSQSIHVMSEMYGKFGQKANDSGDDWTGGTGTGDDWTGTSDSGFVIGSRLNGLPCLPTNGGNPPLPPRRPQFDDGNYTDINPQTLDPDNQYVVISKSPHLYDTVPLENQSPESHYQVPRPQVVVSTSQVCLSEFSDDYCQMMPGRAILRNGSLPMERPPPVPRHNPHKNLPALAVCGMKASDC